MSDKMTKSERGELGQLIRKRERVMKSEIDQRAAQLLAQFDTQSATIYSFDDDPVWRKAAAEAKKVCLDAQEKVAEQCKKLGIPKEFAPGIEFNWYGRGENAVRSRRVELRRMAKSQIEANAQKARVEIERLSLVAQTEVISNGLESAAAREFLERMPSLEKLLPPVNAVEMKQLIEPSVE